MTLPVLTDMHQLLRRLAIEEDDRRRDLANREDRLRRFEDVERPAYESWLRLQFGPILITLEEVSAELRLQRIVAERVTELVDSDGLHPREALHLVRHPRLASLPPPSGDSTRDEIEARRRAKLERKRAQRKQARRELRSANAGADEDEGHGAAEIASRVRMVALYRALARRLHPDSPTALHSLEPARIRTIWAEVQVAYRARSLERMLALSAWLETVGHLGAGVRVGEPHGWEGSRVHLLSLSERHERLRALAKSRRALDRRLTELEREPAWGFEPASAGICRRFRKVAARRLEGELAQVRATLQTVEAFLASIGPPRPRRPARQR